MSWFKSKSIDLESGNGSTNLQSGRDIVFNGLSYQDVKDIANDIFKDNFLTLKKDAAIIAEKRAQEITVNLLDKLMVENPQALNNFNDPAIQDSLFTVQKEYAKSGDEELGMLLVDLLIDRCQSENRSFHSILIDQAIKISVNIEQYHLDILTLKYIFFLNRDMLIIDDLSLKGFNEKFLTFIEPFINFKNGNANVYKYLQAQNCGISESSNGGSIKMYFEKHFMGLFSKGFTKKELDLYLKDDEIKSKLIITNLFNQDLFQINSCNQEDLLIKLKFLEIDESIFKNHLELIRYNKMSWEEIYNYMRGLSKNFMMLDIFWSQGFSNFEITHVGVVLAQANFKRKTGITLEVPDWLIR